MSKWEYLHIEASVDQVITVGPAEKIEIGKFIQGCNPIKNFVNIRHEHYVKFKDDDTTYRVYYAIIEYLGLNGWEPFAVSGKSYTYLHLRRLA